MQARNSAAAGGMAKEMAAAQRKHRIFAPHTTIPPPGRKQAGNKPKQAGREAGACRSLLILGLWQPGLGARHRTRKELKKDPRRPKRGPDGCRSLLFPG